MGEAVSYQLEDGVAWLVIDRPEARNAINQAVGRGLWEGFRRFEEDPAVAVLVLTGTGEAFCAGADLKEMAALGLTVPPREMAPHLGQNLQVTLRPLPRAGERCARRGPLLSPVVHGSREDRGRRGGRPPLS